MEFSHLDPLNSKIQTVAGFWVRCMEWCGILAVLLYASETSGHWALRLLFDASFICFILYMNIGVTVAGDWLCEKLPSLRGTYIRPIVEWVALTFLIVVTQVAIYINLGVDKPSQTMAVAVSDIIRVAIPVITIMLMQRFRSRSTIQPAVPQTPVAPPEAGPETPS